MYLYDRILFFDSHIPFCPTLFGNAYVEEEPMKTDEERGDEGKPRTFSISYEKYRRIAQMIIHHLWQRAAADG